MSPRLVLVAVIVFVAAFAPLPFPKKGTRHGEFDGVWQLAARNSLDGATTYSGGPMCLKVHNDRWTLFVPGKADSEQPYRAELDVTRSPIWITLEPLTRIPAGKKSDRRTVLRGLIQRRGDQLLIIWAARGERPESFHPKNPADILFHFRQLKDSP